MWPFQKETSSPVIPAEPRKIEVAKKITLLTATLVKRGDQTGIAVEGIAEIDHNQDMRRALTAALEAYIKKIKQIPPENVNG